MRTRIILIWMLGCAACSDAEYHSAITAEDLQHHRWVLESIDGQALPASEGKIPELDFGEQMTVSGNLGCNQMNGHAVLRDGFIRIESMAMTRMMCAPPWGDIELKLQTVLSSESTASLDADKSLTITAEGAVLVFRLED